MNFTERKTEELMNENKEIVKDAGEERLPITKKKEVTSDVRTICGNCQEEKRRETKAKQDKDYRY